MGLESRILVSALDQTLGIGGVMTYLNRDENRNYHHHNFERTILSSFSDSLRPYISQVADFETTWADLGRLLRTAITTKLSGLDGERLDKYCSHSDYGVLNSAKNGKLGYSQISEGEAGKQQIAHDIWNDFNIMLFSHVYDVLTGKLDLKICARGKGYCHDLYLIECNPGKPQKYCSIKCRDAESQRQVRARRKVKQAKIRV